MADVEIKYNNSTIASLSDSGTEVLETNGTFLTDDITVEYTKSGGRGTSGMLVTISHTKNGNTHTYTMDKTAGELKTALDSGISIVFYDQYNLMYCSLYDAKINSVTDTFARSIRTSRSTSVFFTASSASSYPTYTYTDSSGGGND